MGEAGEGLAARVSEAHVLSRPTGFLLDGDRLLYPFNSELIPFTPVVGIGQLFGQGFDSFGHLQVRTTDQGLIVAIGRGYHPDLFKGGGETLPGDGLHVAMSCTGDEIGADDAVGSGLLLEL